MFALVIMLMVSTPKAPEPHQVLKVTLQYDTQFTCEQAETFVDGNLIAQLYQLKHRKTSAGRVQTSCSRVNARI